jgi:hypothetical protein
MGSALEISSLGFSGSATYGPDSGQVSFGAMDFTTEPLTMGVFPITSPAATESFAYIANVADPDNPDTSGPNFLDQMTMTISWNQLVNGGEPELDGTGTVLKSFRDTAFTTDFPVGGSATVTAKFPTACDLASGFGADTCDILASMDIGKFEGGDAIPGGSAPPQQPPPPPIVPEPMSSFMALGMALCCLWGTYQLTRGKSGLRFRHETNA